MSNKNIRFDFNNMMSDRVGEEHGLCLAGLQKIEAKSKVYMEELLRERAEGKLPFFDLPYQDVSGILKFAARNKGRFENFVVVGIGGSALGNIALQNSLNSLLWNEMSQEGRGGFCRIYVPDNVDPEYFGGLLEHLDPRKTLFNIISKSGATAETSAQFLIIRKRLEESVGRSFKDHICVTTDKKGGLLRKIVDAEGYENFLVPDGVGGRFSVLSPVGLLSAAMAGIDIQGLLDGAAAMDARCKAVDPFKNPAMMNAALQYLFDVDKGKRISVMMPYSNALRDMADWYRQLWAESLGKRFALDGSEIFCGPTPVKALGTTDQHSQVQLYVEGPNDKVFTFLVAENFRKELPIPSVYKDIEGIDYLGGHTMNELMNAEQKATAFALATSRRPNCSVVFPEISPFTVGQFIYMYEVSTAFAGKLYGINPFDQPGVEEGKLATFALMGRKGYEEKAREMEEWSKSARDRWVIIQ